MVGAGLEYRVGALRAPRLAGRRDRRGRGERCSSHPDAVAMFDVLLGVISFCYCLCTLYQLLLLFFVFRCLVFNVYFCQLNQEG